MDLRSSPSQQHLHPSRSSSLDSHDGRGVNDIEAHQQQSGGRGLEPRSHKLDLYSIPVFLLELVVLIALAYSAYYVHFQYKHEPYLSGFYCDDTSYRQQFEDTKLTEQFNTGQDNELAILSMLLAIPIVIIIFCELVNSMFGSLKFRKIHALCTCCKLHSITRRTIRFSGAYLLGFLIVMISCDILANTTGRLRPYFAQECPNAYQQCVVRTSNTQFKPIRSETGSMLPGGPPPSVQPLTNLEIATQPPVSGAIQPAINPFPPVSPGNSPTSNALTRTKRAVDETMGSTEALARQRPGQGVIAERHWVDLSNANLTTLCNFASGNYDAEELDRRVQSLGMSWPSSPAALFTYACLFLSCYLCFVGTARPFRVITSVLVMVILLIATIFNVELVKIHFHHWDDVAAGAALAFVVVAFVLMVYLNKFKDTHYYENQKLYKRKIYVYENFKGQQSTNDSLPFGQYNLDKHDRTSVAQLVNQTSGVQNGDTAISNDLAMRYFQIPRANYRGAPRPLSSLNQMR